MQALAYPRLVKTSSPRAATQVRRPQTVPAPTAEKKLGSRFLAVLLSALSVWSV
jgi:hypothetical protein